MSNRLSTTDELGPRLVTAERDVLRVDAWDQVPGRADTVIVGLYRTSLSVHTYLTPDEARELARCLLEAADKCASNQPRAA